MSNLTKNTAPITKPSFASKFGLKAGIGKPTTPVKGQPIVGKLLSCGASLVKGKQVDFITIADAETGAVASYWMDSGMRTALTQNGIIALAETGYIVKNKEVIGLEHQGMLDLGGAKTVNNYAIFVS